MTTSSSVQILDPRAAHLFGESVASTAAPVAQLEKLGGGTTWCEGPVWLARFNCLLYSDIPANRIMIWSAQAGVQVWRNSVEFTNGHALQGDGSLLHCSHGERAITRTRFPSMAGQAIKTDERSKINDASQLHNGVDDTLVSRYLGGRLNSPNDIVVKSDGSIWFTDPPYGILSNREGHKAPSEQAHNFVFCFDPNNPQNTLTAMSHWVQEPNGLAFSPDEQWLYVSDTSAALRTDGTGNHHIVKFLVSDVSQNKLPNSSNNNAVIHHSRWHLSNPSIFAVIEPGLADGFKVDQNGFIFTSSENSIQIYHPDGTRIAIIPVPEKIGNCCFGGTGNNELFICASTSLYRIVLNTRGATGG